MSRHFIAGYLNRLSNQVVSARFLATFAPNSPRLKVTEDLLLKILTYHQVSPCFLNFISLSGHQPLSGAGDHFFGGFRSLKSFSEPLSNFKALDRSGFHYQLAFEFRTVFRPPWQENEHVGGDLPIREMVDDFADDGASGVRRGNNANTKTGWRLLPTWFRPRDGEAGGEAGDEAATQTTGQTSDDTVLWPVEQCAIYHHFDVENGKSLWMITAADGESNKPSQTDADDKSRFWDVRDVRFSTNVLSTSLVDERFRASLSVLLWLADWSLSEYSQYITLLDDSLQVLVRLHPILDSPLLPGDRKMS